ncbi:MAG: glycosyltransferase family 2 protein [Candidatus Freyarchaeota archaeon]
MKISVIVTTFQRGRLKYLNKLVESLANQTYKNIELILVVEKDRKLYHELRGLIKKIRPNWKILFNEKITSLSNARNVGAEAAEGDLLAFLDDDVIPAKDWAEKMVETATKFDPAIIGGRVIADWEGKNPEFLPEELYWLIGVTYKGYPDKLTQVRQVHGANFCVKRRAFLKGNKFNENLGFSKSRNKPIGGEEVEFCFRLVKQGRKIIYNPDIRVWHKIASSKLNFKTLFSRGFWYGYTRKIIGKLQKNTGYAHEARYFKTILNFILNSPHELFHNSSKTLKKLFFTISILILVFAGYLYGTLNF